MGLATCFWLVSLGLALVHIGTIGNAAILIVAYVNADYSGTFWERIYHMGLVPGFIVFFAAMLIGLLVLIFGVSPEKKKESFE